MSALTFDLPIADSRVTGKKNLLTRIVEAVQRRQLRRETRRQLNQLSDAMLSDIGIKRSDIATLVNDI